MSKPELKKIVRKKLEEGWAERRAASIKKRKENSERVKSWKKANF